jgi:iron complex transport system substrate-binding protein
LHHDIVSQIYRNDDAGGVELCVGGSCVAACVCRRNRRSVEAFTFSLEQVLSWDPEIIIVTTEPAIAATYADSRLANVSAIKNRRVYAVPMGAHVWGNRTIEQPLTILWAAKLFHPELFKDIVIEDEVRSFYSTFFKTSLRNDDIKTILAGRAGRP